MDWSEVTRWWWWSQDTIQAVWLPAKREIYNSLNPALSASRTYVLSHVPCLLLHRIPVRTHKLYSFNAQIFIQHLLGPRHWAKVFMNSHFLNPHTSSGRSSFLLISFNWGPERWSAGHGPSKWWSWDTGIQIPRPNLSFEATLTFGFPTASKSSSDTISGLLNGWIKGIHGSGFFTSPLTQGFLSWQHNMQCGLNRNQVADNTVGHSLPVFSVIPTPLHPHPLGLRLWVQTNTKPNDFSSVPSNSVILKENKYRTHQHE